MARTTRPSALGDLRLAGSVATGLVAGTLGLGVVVAPLVGWKDWPSALQPTASMGHSQLAQPTPRTAPDRKPGTHKPAATQHDVRALHPLVHHLRLHQALTLADSRFAVVDPGSLLTSHDTACAV